MATYFSPGVYSREIPIGQLPNTSGPIRPAFIGTAKKGPINTPVLITNAQQYIEVFGEPFPNSYLGYAVLAYLEAGNSAYVMRVAVEHSDSLPTDLQEMAIDTSGARGKGWGRIPIFTGMDIGRIPLRAIGDGVGSNPKPVTFQSSSIGDPVFVSAGGTKTVSVSYSTTYGGNTNDSYTLTITSDPTNTTTSKVAGCGYQIVRNSDGAVVSSGTLVAAENSTTAATPVEVGGAGFSLSITCSAGSLGIGDTISFTVTPNNKSFAVSVNGASSTTYTFNSETYDNIDDFLTDANALLSNQQYIFAAVTLEDGTVIPEIQTKNPDDRIQLLSSTAWADTMGTYRYAWDIPRAYLYASNGGPFNFTESNNKVILDVIGSGETKTISTSSPVGPNVNVSSLVTALNQAATINGETYYEAINLTIPGGGSRLVIVTSDDHKFDTLELKANFTNLKTLNFANQVDINSPFRRSYRGFYDSRLELPTPGAADPSVPLSCEVDDESADCASDTNYFANIVGWFVAPYAGTWCNDLSIELSLYTEGLGDVAGRYKIVVTGKNGELLSRIDDISFDKNNARYVSNVLNPGSTYGGLKGNAYVHWEDRPGFLNNDVSLTTYEVRSPSQFNLKSFVGANDGIPTDPSYSNYLDAAVIGNQALATGLHAFANPEAIEIDLLATPGFSSGSVIGTAIQIVSNRGDAIYLVDPPFGLRPQQTVDWHNGILLSDLRQAINTGYAALYSGWLLIYDQFSKQNLWVPPSGHVSAVFSRSSKLGELWSAPAGLRRASITNAIAVEYSPTKGEQDLMYGSGNAVNPIVNFTREGLTIWGNRTLLRGDSVLSRVSSRLLVNNVRKYISNLLRQYVFEPNDSRLWVQIKSSITPYLADIQSRRGLYSYVVVIDENNNTPERMDRGELWISIIIAPTPTAEFIILNLGVTRSGVSMTSEEAQSAVGIIN